MTTKSGAPLRIFAHDPGSRNYGYAIVEGRLLGKRVDFRVLENGLCPCPVNNLKDHKVRRSQVAAYQKWMRGLIRKYKIRGIFAERYMTRGIKGPTIESVNMMLGILQAELIPDRYIPAAVWKNAVARSGIELKDEYKICRTAPHQLDASLIGVWGLHQAFGIKDFGAIKYKTFVNLVRQVENTSQAKLFNRKTTR